MKTSLLFLLALFLFAGSELIFSQNANHSQNKGGFVYLTAPDGTEKALSDTGDVDGDGISNELEVNGYTFSALGGLKPWNGDPNVKHYITDPLRWSTDGDPYSDYMEVTGINMPASISAPENDPLVAARPIISIKMTDYTVETLATISNSNGGHVDSTFTNETSNSDEVGAEVTVEASLNPFELVGGSVTGSYSHTWTSTNSTTANIGKDWNDTRTTQPLCKKSSLHNCSFLIFTKRINLLSTVAGSFRAALCLSKTKLWRGCNLTVTHLQILSKYSNLLGLREPV